MARLTGGLQKLVKKVKIALRLDFWGKFSWSVQLIAQAGVIRRLSSFVRRRDIEWVIATREAAGSGRVRQNGCEGACLEFAKNKEALALKSPYGST